ncbi:MAG: protease modulator HflC [Planctomycetota bacterium]|nr:protease modulator HflC [Planctomycetota bacterium]
MKTRIAATVLVILGIAAIVLYSSAYIVEEGKQVIVTQFGKPVDDVQDAGLHFKTPFIQEAYYLEKRLLPWDGAPESMQTKDKKRIDIDVWARWHIIHPMTFFVKVRNEARGQKILDDLVDSAVRDVVARHNLIDVVRKSNDELIYETEELERTEADPVMGNGRDDVEDEILRGVDLKEYGMELVKVRIKRVNYVASVRATVYERMISERLRIARLYDSEAQEEKNRILGQTTKELDQIEGEMEQKDAEIRGEANAQVIQMTAEAYGQSPDFYEFLRRLEVLKTTLDRDTRLILSTESDLFRMLKEPGQPMSAPVLSPRTSP